MIDREKEVAEWLEYRGLPATLSLKELIDAERDTAALKAGFDAVTEIRETERRLRDAERTIKIIHEFDVIAGHEPTVAAMAIQLAEAQRRIADYENSITWNVTCLRCADALDKDYELYVIKERLRELLAKWKPWDSVGAVAEELSAIIEGRTGE